MKKLFIFLMLFSFALAGYCAEVLISENTNRIVDSSDTPSKTWPCSYDDITIPSDGNYRVYCKFVTAPTSGTVDFSVDYVASVSLTTSYQYFDVSYSSGDNCRIITGIWSEQTAYVIAWRLVKIVTGEVPEITSVFSGITVTAGETFTYTTTATGTETIVYGSSLPPYLSGNGASITGTIPSDFTTNYGNYFTFTVTATNDYGSDSQLVTVNVEAPAGQAPEITSADSISVISGESLLYDVTATGDPVITYSVSTLPNFLVFSGGHLVNGGIPLSQTEDFTFTVTATNDYGSDSQLVTVHVEASSGEAPEITSSVSVSAVCGQSFSYTTTATGSPTITYSSSSLPAFLSGNGSSISGTIPASLTEQTYTFTVTAVNDYGSDSKTVTINASAGSGDGHYDSDDDVPAINEVRDVIELFNGSFNSKMEGVYDRLDYIEDFLVPAVHNDFQSVIDILNEIKNNTSSGSTSIETSDLDLPAYEFDTNFGDFTAAYSDEDKKDKARSPFSFLNDKLNDLSSIQAGEAQKFEVTFVGVVPGATENPYIIISQDTATSPYVQALRMFFSIILYILGLFWWTHIIMLYFV